MMVLVLVPGVIRAQSNKEGPSSVLQPAKISVDAKSGILMDAYTGQVLVESNSDLRIEPASFAKLLTLYIVFDTIRREKLTLDDEIFISKDAWKTEGSKMFIRVNSKVSVREIVKGIAIVSGNDACVAIAEHLSGSVDIFVNAMNEMAKRIGMQNSHFANPHGLPDKQQYTTAHDMALLARMYVNDFPEALQFHSMQEYTYSGIRQYNRNSLLRKDASVDGLKTGYISDSAYHLLATAKRDNRRLIAVVMGAKSRSIREREAQKLLTHGFQNFEVRALFTKNQVVAEIPVWKGAKSIVPVVATESGVLTVPVGYKGKLYEDRILPKDIVAPLSKGQVIGKSIIKIDSDVVKSIPLVVSHDIQRAGFFKLLLHNIYLVGKNNIGVFLVLIMSLIVMALLYSFVVPTWRKRKGDPLRI
jgi:D-alanyl-D-alanine carboxypeptidase (penicillin-binding protein 5/6)